MAPRHKDRKRECAACRSIPRVAQVRKPSMLSLRRMDRRAQMRLHNASGDPLIAPSVACPRYQNMQAEQQRRIGRRRTGRKEIAEASQSAPNPTSSRAPLTLHEE